MQGVGITKKGEDRLLLKSKDIPTTLISRNPFDQNLDVYINYKIQKKTNEQVTFRSERINANVEKGESKINWLGDEKIRYAMKDVNTSPQNPYLINNLGLAYLANNNLEQAYKCFEEAIKLNGDFKAAHLNLATVHRAKGDDKKALDIYKTLVRIYPDDRAILINIVNVYLLNHQIEEAEKILDKIWINKTINVDAGNKLAIVKLIKGDYKSAITILRKCIQKEPNNPAFYNNLGVAFLGLNITKKASLAFQSAISLLPNYSSAIANYVKVLSKTEKIHAGIKFLEEYLESNKDNGLTELLVELYIDNNQYDYALRRVNRLISEAKKSKNLTDLARLLNNAGVIYHQIYELDHAESFYEESIKLDDFRHIVPLTNMIDLYFDKGDLVLAKTYIDLIRQKFPKEAIFYFYSGVYNSRLQNAQRAILDLEQYLNYDPNSIGALCSLGYVYTELVGDYDKAIELLITAKENNLNDINIINNLVYAYLMKGELDKASKELAAYTSDEYNLYLTATRGLFEIKKGNIDQGRKLYNDAAKMTKNQNLKEEVFQKKELEIAKHFLANNNTSRSVDTLKKLLANYMTPSIYRKQAEYLIQNLDS